MKKSYKIAEKVGYQDANYFSYVFKKKFGVSPSKYRVERAKDRKSKREKVASGKKGTGERENT